MRLPIWKLDAFAARVFAGNPAAVCLLPRWPADPLLRAIAAENNLSETAFLVRREDGTFEIRWMTPEVEVDLCGHATLAAGFVVLERLEPGRSRVTFHSRQAGDLGVAREGALLALDFPARPPVPAPTDALLVAALGREPLEVHRARDLVAVLGSEDEVRALSPDLAAVRRLDALGLAVTAPGRECDFVSRYFAPQAGIDEDPVTGSVHCTLAPLWAEKLGRTTLLARQVSNRGGELLCALRGDRVSIAGRVVPFLEGTIEVPE